MHDLHVLLFQTGAQHFSIHKVMQAYLAWPGGGTLCVNCIWHGCSHSVLPVFVTDV